MRETDVFLVLDQVFSMSSAAPMSTPEDFADNAGRVRALVERRAQMLAIPPTRFEFFINNLRLEHEVSDLNKMFDGAGDLMDNMPSMEPIPAEVRRAAQEEYRGAIFPTHKIPLVSLRGDGIISRGTKRKRKFTPPEESSMSYPAKEYKTGDIMCFGALGKFVADRPVDIPSASDWASFQFRRGVITRVINNSNHAHGSLNLALQWGEKKHVENLARMNYRARSMKKEQEERNASKRGKEEFEDSPVREVRPVPEHKLHENVLNEKGDNYSSVFNRLICDKYLDKSA